MTSAKIQLPPGSTPVMETSCLAVRQLCMHRGATESLIFLSMVGADGDINCESASLLVGRLCRSIYTVVVCCVGMRVVTLVERRVVVRV